MNLNYRFAKAFSLLVFFTLLLGIGLIYYALERATMRSAILKMEGLNNYVAEKIKKDENYNYLSQHHNQVQVQLIKESSPEKKYKKTQEKYIWNSSIQSYINRISVTSYATIRGKKYAITNVRYITIIEKRFLFSLIMVIAWIMVFLIILTIITSVVVSSKILDPFYHALEEIKNFRIKEKKSLKLMNTNIHEFRLLNNFLEKMTDNSRKDYYLLEELTENTSHELQTPLASIKGKIELLMETSLSEKQFITLSSMNDELDRLSSVNKSLILLAKLEHFEAGDSGYINFSQLLHERISYFDDIFSIQNITLKISIDEDVFIRFDENLAVIVLDNLLSNAKRHNTTNGYVSILLTAEHLIISNTGNPPLLSNHEVFERFKRGNPNQNSIGIGLALVKRILEIFNYEISYQFHQNWHTMTVVFKS
ncbi:sensor histidine kinase [Chryseobacterium sp. GP-SGM7]|uniref:sensor histidine kinase n=1 Tax=Chryseobacterium sp. GP-SGM7 TaxID=3411323 RepID=UPI003B95C61F